LDDEQAIEMVNAIAAMKVVPTTPSSHFPSCQPSPGNPSPSPAASVVEHLEQLISKIIKAKLSTSAEKSEDPETVAPAENLPEDVAAEASRLEFKTVDELHVHMRLWNL